MPTIDEMGAFDLIRYCSCKLFTPDGSPCGTPHTESGYYCAECRRRYQSEWRKGTQGSRGRESTQCTLCENVFKSRMKLVNGEPACPACELVVKHLQTMTYEQQKHIFALATDVTPERSSRDAQEPLSRTRQLGITDSDPYTQAIVNGTGWSPKTNRQPIVVEQVEVQRDWRYEALDAFKAVERGEQPTEKGKEAIAQWDREGKPDLAAWQQAQIDAWFAEDDDPADIVQPPTLPHGKRREKEGEEG